MLAMTTLCCLQAAAQEAYQRFQAQGEGVASIATKGEGGAWWAGLALPALRF